MCYCDEEKILIIHDYFKKELIFLHLNIVSFKEPGIYVPSLYGNCIKLNESKRNLFALKEDTILQIFVNVNKDGYQEVITIGERKKRQIESFSPLGENRVILGIEGGEISVYEYSRLSQSKNHSNYELLSKTCLTPIFERRVNTDWSKKFGCITVSKNGDQVLASTFEKEKCAQRELILLDVNDFGAMKVLRNKDLSSVTGDEEDSGYGFLDMDHSIYGKTLIFASQMKTGKECHAYYIDDNDDLKALFSFQINPEGFSCTAISLGIKYYTLTSKGKFQIYPLGFHKYALPNLDFSEFDSKLNDSMLSTYQRSSWKKKQVTSSFQESSYIKLVDSSWRQKKGEKYKNSFKSKVHNEEKFQPLVELSSKNSRLSSINRSNYDHPFTFSTGSFESRSNLTVSDFSKENFPPELNKPRQSRYKNSNLGYNDMVKYQSRGGNRMTFGINESINTLTKSKKRVSFGEEKPPWNLSYFDSKVELGKIKFLNLYQQQQLVQ